MIERMRTHKSAKYRVRHSRKKTQNFEWWTILKKKKKLSTTPAVVIYICSTYGRWRFVHFSHLSRFLITHIFVVPLKMMENAIETVSVAVSYVCIL